jgi:hypothetical protein
MREHLETVLDPSANLGPRGTDAIAEVTELPLLLPSGEASALEQAARRRGLTVGQMLRQLVREFLHEAGRPGPR